jgi:hypothetical protein
MNLDIPNEREDERLDREHEREQIKHLKDHVGDEMREAKDREQKAKEKATRVLKAEVGEKEKADRRQQDETDAALAETANTVFREE